MAAVDIAWIDTGKIIGTSAMVPCQGSGLDRCPRWSPPGPIDAALEDTGLLARITHRTQTRPSRAVAAAAPTRVTVARATHREGRRNRTPSGITRCSRCSAVRLRAPPPGSRAIPVHLRTAAGTAMVTVSWTAVPAGMSSAGCSSVVQQDGSLPVARRRR